ncbi:MAG TPA: pitrilysin family protein [Solimonas sp.]|nr:pitrilysin family protein [Solimonas sp.]
MRYPTPLLCMLLALAGAASAKPGAQEFPDIDISYEKHILPNGLTLLIHEDHKAPMVAINVWYHVGSKDEKPGRTGFAHLFEHLMFNGSEHYNDEFFRPLNEAGATKMNGTTWNDRTNYFENVPTAALDRALWMESDRMGWLLDAIDQKKLDEQRGVVLNEKRQGENEPYGKVDDLLLASLYPPQHPYSWSTIGSEADLNAAALDDVKQWFRDNYGAANVTLVIAGDVVPADVKKKVEFYFGNIAPGPVRKRQGPWISPLAEDKRVLLQDRVPQARLIRAWSIPGYCHTDNALMDIAGGILADGKNSRLYKRLVYQDQIATSVSTGSYPFEIGTPWMIDTYVRPGGDAAVVEKAVNEELARFLREGPTAEELSRLKTKYFAGWLRGLEQIDGFSGKSSTLAHYQVYCGSPDRYKDVLATVRKAGSAEVLAAARKWLAYGSVTMNVEPFPDYAPTEAGADRAKMPELAAAPELKLPPLQRTTLANGLKVVLAERHAAPVVQMNLMVDAGFAADVGAKPGTASLALNMLDEGTATRDALAIGRRKEELGAEMGAGSDLDTSYLNLNALVPKIEPSIELFADVLRHPSFPEKELVRLKKQTLASIQQEKVDPSGIASRLYSRLLFGEGHAYSNPLSGTGTEESVQALAVEDLRTFYRRWVRPDNATLLVVGDTTIEKIKPLLERYLGNWRAPDEAVPSKPLAQVALQPKPRVFLVNRTGAEQTLIFAAHVAPPKNDPDSISMDAAELVFGGSFLSRINMNLREDKHWSYGAGTDIVDTKAQRPFLVNAPVQTDKTVESIKELVREFGDVLGARPLNQKELKLARDRMVRRMPGFSETSGEIAGLYSTVLKYNLPDSYWNDYVTTAGNMSQDAMNAAIRKLLKPDALTWIIVGDVSKFESGVRALNLGEVKVLDADGKVLR